MVTAVAVNAADVAISFARAQLGKPYRFGALGPGAWDCSGLVVGSFKAAGVSLPHYTGFLISKGIEVSRAELQPGDLVFPDPGHVQIYTGSGTVIEAPHSGAVVREVPMWGFWRARRIVPGGSGGGGQVTNPVEGFSSIPGVGVIGDALGLDKWITQFMSGARHWAIRVFEVLLGGALIVVGLDKLGFGGGQVTKLAKYAK